MEIVKLVLLAAAVSFFFCYFIYFLVDYGDKLNKKARLQYVIAFTVMWVVWSFNFLCLYNL